MKNVLKITAVMALSMLTLSGCNCFKDMAKNADNVKIACTPEVLTLNNGKIVANIAAEIPANYFDKTASLKVTPAIFFEGGVVTGETILLQGEKVATNGIVVKKGENLSINREVVFNYQPAMDACELKLLVEVKCKSGKCKEFTLVNASTGEVLTEEQAAVIAKGGAEAVALQNQCALKVAAGLNTLQKELNFAEAMQPESNNYKNVTTTVVKADIVYAINSSRVSKKAMKSSEIEALKNGVVANLSNDRAAQTVYVNGYASPDGPEKFNDKLSNKRSQSGLKEVKKLLKETGLNIDAAAYGEDWDGFKAAVAASSIEDKNLILQVLEMYSSAAEREKEIKNLSSVFKALKTEVLPQLRRAQIVNSTDLTGKTDDEMAAIVTAGNASELSLEELLHIAEARPALAEAALAVAAKQYGDTRAYNNLAVAQANAGNYEAALKSLEAAAKAGSKTSELNNNYALVYLAMGETAKAEEYAKAATAETKALVAAAKGDYAAASKSLEGYNAAVAHVQDGNLAAAKKSLAGDASAKADYLRAVIAAKEGNIADGKASLNNAISKDATLAAKAAKDVNLKVLF